MKPLCTVTVDGDVFRVRLPEGLPREALEALAASVVKATLDKGATVKGTMESLARMRVDGVETTL